MDCVLSHLPQRPEERGAEGSLLSLPEEVLREITLYVSTTDTPQEAALHAVRWGRVSRITHRMTHESGVQKVLKDAEHLKHLDEALEILWDRCIAAKQGKKLPQLDAAKEIRDWMMADLNQALLLKICVQEIDLSHCRLKVVPPEICYLSDLTKLDLSNNKITQIGPQAFAGCLALSTLNLKDNQITQIGPKTFAGCPALSTLNLKDNQITQIGSQAFGCPTLRYLYLDRNRITQIGPQAFAGCKDLKALTLENNPIVQIASQAFVNCIALKKCSLESKWLLCTVNPKERDLLRTFKAFARYRCQSEWAKFYQAVFAGSLPPSAIVEQLRQLEDHNWIYKMVYLEAKEAAEREGKVFSTDGDDQWGEHHVCDDMLIFCTALKRGVLERFATLSQEQQSAVHRKICEIDRSNGNSVTDYGKDPVHWGKEHREEHVLRLIDAMELI